MKEGDFALVDTGDRHIIWGELYLVAQTRGPILWAVCKPRGIWTDHAANPDRPTVMLRPLAGRYRTNEEAVKATPARAETDLGKSPPWGTPDELAGCQSERSLLS